MNKFNGIRIASLAKHIADMAARPVDASPLVRELPYAASTIPVRLPFAPQVDSGLAAYLDGLTTDQLAALSIALAPVASPVASPEGQERFCGPTMPVDVMQERCLATLADVRYAGRVSLPLIDDAHNRNGSANTSARYHKQALVFSGRGPLKLESKVQPRKKDKSKGKSACGFAGTSADSRMVGWSYPEADSAAYSVCRRGNSADREEIVQIASVLYARAQESGAPKTVLQCVKSAAVSLRDMLRQRGGREERRAKGKQTHSATCWKRALAQPFTSKETREAEREQREAEGPKTGRGRKAHARIRGIRNRVSAVKVALLELSAETVASEALPVDVAEQYKTLVRCLAGGMSQSEAAEALKVSRQMVSKMVRNLRENYDLEDVRGESARTQKVALPINQTDDMAQTIRARLLDANDSLYASIAAKLGFQSDGSGI